MNFLADAHISAALVEFVRRSGHDCTKAIYLPLRTPDTEVLGLAVREQRVVLTADKDFGELVFRDGMAVPGVVLLRLPDGPEADRLAVVMAAWPEVCRRVIGHFVTITPDRIRSRPLE